MRFREIVSFIRDGFGFKKRPANTDEATSQKLKLEGEIRPSGHLVVRKITNDGTEATRVIDRQGRSTTTDLDSDGSITFSIEGRPPQNETGNLIPCRILIERLNADGNQWGAPSNPKGEEDGVDCIAHHQSDELRMQVTRVARQELWRELATTGFAKKNPSVENLVSDLREAVRKKETLAIEQRKKITLVLDAVDHPSYTYSTIVENFKKKYRIEIRKLGFEAIWLIGPTIEMTARLDIEF